MSATTEALKTPSTKLMKKVGWRRPINMAIEITLKPGGRKVTPKDLEVAMAAGLAAIRASLEGRYKPYEIASVAGQVSYSYVQSQVKVKG